jgi:hypothetical protein
VSTDPFGSNPNPYQPPAGSPSPMNFGGPQAMEKVQGPAIGLMITGGIGVALSLLALVLNMLGTGLGAAGGGDQQIQVMAQGGLGIVQSVVGLAISGFALYGGMQMKQLQNYGLAFGASILVMIPCLSPCCLIGLPIGIWSIVVLNDPMVKASFR